MTPEAYQTISSITSTGIGMICLTLIILVVAPCLTWLIHTGKIRNLAYKRGQGFAFEANDDGNEVALQLLDRSLDDADGNFKRSMLAIAYDCFRENQPGQRHATQIAALNHCMRDLLSVGLTNYIDNAKQIGGWSDAEAECFTRGMLVSARKLIDARLDAYEKCLQIKTTEAFRKITNRKIEKNNNYDKLISRYLGDRGMVSGIIQESGDRIQETGDSSQNTGDRSQETEG